MDQIANIRINTDVVRGIRTRFDNMLLALRADELRDDGNGYFEARCLVITAESGAGKSHVLQRLRENRLLVEYEDDEGPVKPLVDVTAPSPCTLKTLGLEIYQKLTGKRLRDSVREHEIWANVRAQLDAQLVSVLMIDEFHHALLRARDADRRSLVETLKNLLVGQRNARPVMLVLSGMPETYSVIERDDQLKRRCFLQEIDPLGNNAADLRRATLFLQRVEEKLGFPESSKLAEVDMVRRMMRASGGYLGRMMAYVKEASNLALQSNASRLDREKHLAVAFEEIFRVGPSKNPFLVADPDKCERPASVDYKPRTLLRGVESR